MKPKVLTTLVLASLSALFFAGCGGSTDVSALIQKADSQIQAGKLAEAEILLKNALREEQKNPQALALIGEIYKQQGRLRDAYKVLSAVKQLAPNDAPSLASLASIELAAGMRDEALADARKALELDSNLEEAPILLAELAADPASAAQTTKWLESLPQTPSIHAAIGSLYLKSGNIGVASQHFEQAIEADPNSSMGYTGRFQILLAQKKQEEAMAAFAKAAEVAPVRSGIRIRYAQYLQQSQGDEAAKAALDEILAAAPDYLPALGLAAELAAKMEQPKESKKLVERALKLDPIDPTALRITGTLLVLEQKFDEAISQLEKTLELYPEDIKANYQIALAYLAKHDLGKAKSCLSRVVQKVPGHLEANALLSTIQVQEEDYSGAIITLEKFLKANPNSIQGYLLLAEAYNRQGNNEAAVAIYKKLENAQPENPQLDYLSGLSYLQGQNFSGARSAFEAALSTNPLHLQSVEQLTALDLGERNFDNALERIDQTIAASPDTSVLYTIRAQVLQSKGDIEAAVESFEKSIELDPNNRTARTLYARLLRSQGDEANAMAQAQAILETNPEDIEALTTIASLHESAERFKEAVDVYEKILTIDNTNIPALNNLAYLYSTKFEKADRAFELAQKARELAPTNPYPGDTLGWIVFNRGDYRWAISLLSESYKKLQGNPEVAYHLGSAHYFAGNETEAKKLLEFAAKSEQPFTGKADAQEKSEILSIDTSSATSTSEEHLIAASENGDPFAWVARARISEDKRAIKDSLVCYQNALKISPNHFAALIGKALALAQTGNLVEAKELAEQAIKQAPNDPTAISIQGQIAYLAGDHIWATSRLSEAARIDPQNKKTLKYLVFSAFAIGELEQAKAAAAQFQALTATDELLPWLQTLDALLASDAKWGPIDEIPAEMRDLYDGTNALKANDDAQAEDSFRSVLKDYPNQKQAKLGLAVSILNDPSNLDEIERLANEVRKLDRNNPTARALQGIVAFQKNQKEPAIRILTTLSSTEIQEQNDLIQAKINEILSPKPVE